MERGALQFCPHFPSRYPPASCGKASKVGRVYRATALQNTPPVCSILHRAPFSLAAPAKKKKSILLVFKHQPLMRVGGPGVDLFLAAPAPACVPGRACLPTARTRSGLSDPQSLRHLLLPSSALQHRHMFAGFVCMCVSSRALSSGGEGGGRPSLPAFPETPNPN